MRNKDTGTRLWGISRRFNVVEMLWERCVVKRVLVVSYSRAMKSGYKPSPVSKQQLVMSVRKHTVLTLSEILQLYL